MKWTSNFLAACVVVGFAGVAAAAEPGKRVPVLETFGGTAAADKKPDLKTGFIAAEEKWKEVWEKVGGKEKLPKVDFAKHILLVTEKDAADPNRGSATVSKDDKGAVTVNMISTLIGFEPSGQTKYTFHKVSREGVTAVRRFDPAAMKMVSEPLPK